MVMLMMIMMVVIIIVMIDCNEVILMIINQSDNIVNKSLFYVVQSVHFYPWTVYTAIQSLTYKVSISYLRRSKYFVEGNGFGTTFRY